jgi:murein DD-endopeptidase MepM/ murein hydrolase activator NlpD
VVGSFRVTKSAVQHIASGGPPAIDLGDGDPDADAILACTGGRVVVASKVGSANLEIDYTDPFGRRVRVVYAHNLLPHPVTVGQTVVFGQQIGRVGSTGASAAHLHLQIGEITPPNGVIVWLDPWPLLAQNRPEETDVTFIPNAGYVAIGNRATAIRAGSYVRSGPTTQEANKLTFVGTQTEWQPAAQCNGELVNGSAIWYAGPLALGAKGRALAFVHSSRVILPMTVVETVPDPTLVTRLAGKQTALETVKSEAENGIAI